MQTNKTVEKFSKKPKQVVDYRETPVAAKGKKFNKPKRGQGTYKASFLSMNKECAYGNNAENNY